MRNTIEVRHYDNYNGGGARVYENGDLVMGATAGGCGYDRNNAALAKYVMIKYGDRLTKAFYADFKKLQEKTFSSYCRHESPKKTKKTMHFYRDTKADYYGIRVTESFDVAYKKDKKTDEYVEVSRTAIEYKVDVDGACGSQTVTHALEKIGVTKEWLNINSKVSNFYVLRDSE